MVEKIEILFFLELKGTRTRTTSPLMIHVKDNQCPICLTDNLCWNLDIQKSDMQMFKCGHGTCKSCYTKWKTSKTEFTCPTCREIGQSYSNGFDIFILLCVYF